MKDIPVDNANAWRAEDQRQAQLFAEAMQKAIEKTTASLIEAGHKPLLNAVAGAIVTVEAGMFAALVTGRSVKALKAAMDKQRPRALAAARERNTSRVETIIIGGDYGSDARQ